ncbi:hypothetical protein Tco_0844941 [Tanacetum coccineum]
MGDTVKDMTVKFGKLDKFEGNDFRHWQKKMHFLLTTLKVVYMLSTPMPDLSDALFDVYQNVGSAKELWDQLESKYMAEDAFSKKFLVSNFNNYKMTDSRFVMEQYHELLILGQFTQHDLNTDVSISVSKVTLRAEDSGKGKGKEIASASSVNMIEDGKNKKQQEHQAKEKEE